jgi:hypothetical protein
LRLEKIKSLKQERLRRIRFASVAIRNRTAGAKGGKERKEIKEETSEAEKAQEAVEVMEKALSCLNGRRVVNGWRAVGDSERVSRGVMDQGSTRYRENLLARGTGTVGKKTAARNADENCTKPDLARR